MIQQVVLQRIPGAGPYVELRPAKLVHVCEEFQRSGRADPKFLSELTSGVEQKFWASVSEALVAYQLRDKTFPARRQIGVGPDFLVTNGPQRVWIEVICPEPTNVSASQLTPAMGAIDFPYVDILLRWTSAIKIKAERLIGDAEGKVLGYLKEGVVAPEDAYVIAVNGCRMRSGGFPQLTGISKFPFAAEAVFPIGPSQVHFDRQTLKVIGRNHQYRPDVKKRNAALVRTSTFLDSAFAPVSAIWALDLDGSASCGGLEPMLVVHNPLATNRIAQGFLPAEAEYICTIESDDMRLEKVVRA